MMRLHLLLHRVTAVIAEISSSTASLLAAVNRASAIAARMQSQLTYLLSFIH